MLIKMNRSQRTELGMLRAGVAYNIDEGQNGRLLDRLLKVKKFAVKTTKAQLKKDADSLAAREAAQQASAEGSAVEPALVTLADETLAAKAAVEDAQAALDATEPKTPDRKEAESDLKAAQLRLDGLVGSAK